MRRMVILGLLLIIGAFILLTNNFNDKKKAEYKNDERWQLIKLKVNSVILKYFNVIIGIVGLGFIFFDAFILNSPTIPIANALKYVFYLLLLRYPVEYFALRYYDGKL